MLTLLNLLIDLFTLFFTWGVIILLMWDVHPISNSPASLSLLRGSFLLLVLLSSLTLSTSSMSSLVCVLSILLAPLIISLLVNAACFLHLSTS
ncbi:unnamed protein product [Microthlaspi erraticum]|uniref:Uncharacterized protein n=1 Tax=Microthlaspi erraticum TaxID=1685480 RepID=A0A6D2K0I5_9BRAS|nr:unnamed protein product [Microthlaspi erraticum]